MVQQRPPSSWRGSSNKDIHWIVDVPNQSQQHFARNDESDDVHTINRRKKNWVHVIPAVVILCLFILWWFSYPVSIERKDFRIIAIHDTPMSINNTHVQLAVLDPALPPFAPSPQDFMINDVPPEPDYLSE